jgi:DNA-damage-inducible protein J
MIDMEERRFIMTTIQITVDDAMKAEADSLFNNLGLDTSTAVKMFLSTAIANNAIPFAIDPREPNADLLEAIADTRNRRNLHGPYKTAEEAVAAMLEG